MTWGCCAGAPCAGALTKSRHRRRWGRSLRAFMFGRVRQSDAVASRFLINLACWALLLGSDDDQIVVVGVDDAIIGVHGGAKQGVGFGYSGVRGLSALIGTALPAGFASVLFSSRMRKGAAVRRGASSGQSQACWRLSNARTWLDARFWCGSISAFHSHAIISAAITGGAGVLVTSRMDPAVKGAIATIAVDAWTKIRYTNAIYDEEAQEWIYKAEVAETPFTAHPP